jgi:hypothetical protein
MPRLAPSKIYEAVVSRCRSAPLPKIWRRVLGPGDLLGPGQEWPGIFDYLRENFSDDELRASGVVASVESDGLALAPQLNAPGALILPLRHSADEAPNDLLVCGESIAGRALPLLAMRQRRPPTERTNWDGSIFVCATMIDVAVLRSVGMSAAPATGLETLGGRTLDQFCRATHRDRRPASCTSLAGPSANSESIPVPLVLVNWSPAELAPGPIAEIDPTRAHLLRIESHLDIDLQDCDVWTPDVSDCARIRTCVQFGDRQDIRAALEHSFATRITSLAGKSVMPESTTYASAQRRWFDGATQSEGRQQKAAWTELLKAHQQDVLDGILQKAADAMAPTERLLWSTLADISRMRHMQAASMMIPYLQHVAGQAPRGDFSLPAAAFSQQMQLVKQALNLAQEIHRLRGVR